MEWLRQLADAVSCEPKLGTIEAYLEELARWKLSDEQWLELRRRAVLRHRFPRILPLLAELDDIRRELIAEAQTRADNERRRESESGERVPCPPEVRVQLEGLFRK